MKKLLVLFLAMALTLAAGSQAFAALATGLFGDSELIRVVYSRTGAIEFATDLGNVNTLAGTTDNKVGGGTSAFTLSNTGASSYGDLYVAYYGIHTDSSDSTQSWAYVSGSQNTATKSGSRQLSQFQTATSDVRSLYTILDLVGTSSVAAQQSQSQSYRSKMDKGSTNAYGAFGGLITNYPTYSEGELNLAALGTGGSVTQVLYGFQGILTTATTGTATLVLQTNADGSTIINPSAVPIPPAFFLMGSGLLGLVGLKRRSSMA